jgi:hypothetical protein
MKTAWGYVEKYHDRCGVALFIVPVLLVAWTAIGICWGLASLVP